MKKKTKKAIVRISGSKCAEVSVPANLDIGDLADVKKAGPVEEFVRLEIIAISGEDASLPPPRHWFKRLALAWVKYTFIGGLVTLANVLILSAIVLRFMK